MTKATNAKRVRMKVSRRKRVLMLLENNPYSQDIRVKREANALVKAGYHVSVICPKPPNDKAFVKKEVGLHLYQYPSITLGNGFVGYIWEYSYAFLMMFLLSFVVWLRDGIDIIHAHNPPDIMFIIAAFYKLWGKKFIFDHHDLSPEMFCARFGKPDSHFVYKVLAWFERMSCRVADHVIATNDSYKQIQIARNGLLAEQITVVRNGPNERLAPSAPDPALRQKATILLGYAGIIGPQDGVDYLLRVLHQLVYQLNRRDIFCVIMGKSDILAELKALTKTLDLEEYVWFTGWFGEEELLRYLSTVDICLDPDPSNPYNDRCTMIKMMEYMALGKPIVAFDLPEHRISAADAAIYARPNDEYDFAQKIAELIDSPDRRQQMGQIGRKRIETKFAWSYQEQNLLSAYEKVA